MAIRGIGVLWLVLLASGSGAQQPAISGADAAADVREMRALLDTESSYARLGDDAWRSRLGELSKTLESQPVVTVDVLRGLLAGILGDLGDRHSSVRHRGAPGGERRGELPVALARVGERLVVLRPREAGYELFDAEAPYLETIDGLSVSEAIDAWVPEHRSAPELARLTQAAWALRRLGRATGQRVGETVSLTLTAGPGGTPREATLSLVERGPLHVDGGALWSVYREPLREGRYEELARRLSPRIAYLALPEMESLARAPALRSAVRSAMTRFRGASALVLDVRSNFGGTRDLLWELAPYIVPPSASPWIANVAFVRSDQQLDEEIESMTARYLLPARSDRLDDRDRRAAVRFLQSFRPRRPVPEERFSAPYFMVLRAGDEPFEGAVFVLANEQSMSAASVFVTALKGLPNVTVAGVRTDGSSGRSRRHRLANSQLEIRLSTMASYQRDGTTLDGNGTAPDLEIEVPLEQRLTGRDLQLEALVAEIERRLDRADG